MKNLKLFAIIAIVILAVSCKKDKTIISEPNDFQISSGNDHSMLLLPNGKLYGVGLNSAGQLGINKDTFSMHNFTFIADNIKQIACGGYHTLVIDKNNKLYSVGRNDYGQLGDNSTTNRKALTFILDNAKSIAANNFHSFVLKNDGTLWASGRNTSNGYLGTGSDNSPMVFTQVLTNVKEISAGAEHTIALKNDNTVWGVGDNDFGQLAIGGTAPEINTFEQLDITDAKAISAGSYHTLVLKNDNSVWATGRNQFGEFGKAPYVNTAGFVNIASDVKQMQAGNGCTFLVKNNDSLYVSGYNFGQLGTGDNAAVFTFKSIVGNIKSVFTSASPNTSSSFVYTNDNKLFATGSNPNYKLGDGTDVAKKTYTLINIPN